MAMQSSRTGPPWNPLRLLGVTLFVLTLAACGDDDTPSQPAAENHAAHPVASLALEPATATLTSGDSLVFTATPRCGCGTLVSRPVEWSADHPELAELHADGSLHALGPGLVRITATSEGVTNSALVAITPRGTVLGTAGGVAASDDGGALVRLWPGAVTGDTDVTVEPVADEGVPAAFGYVPGTAYRFGPEGLEFGNRAEITVRYRSEDVPPGILRTRLRLHHLVDGAWQPVAGGGVDEGLGEVNAPVEHFSIYGVAEYLPPVAAVEVVPAETELVVGEQVRLEVELLDDEGATLTDRPVVWSASDDAGVVVDVSGYVTARSAGLWTVVATSEGVSGSAAVRVLDPVASIELSPSEAEVTVGSRVALVATARDATGTELAYPTFTWTSSDPRVASVASGTVSGLEPGTARISAISQGVTATATVTVTAPVASVVVTPSYASLGIGEQVQLRATVLDETGEPVDVPVHWFSSSPTSAPVDSDGRVTGVAKGEVTITAVSGDLSGLAIVHVHDPIRAVAVSPSLLLMAPGDEADLSAVPLDERGRPTDVPVSWTTADPDVAIVTEEGRVVALSEGQTTIMVEVDGRQGRVAVTVRVPVASVALTPDPLTVEPGGSASLRLEVLDAEGEPLARAATWSIADEAVASVAASAGGASVSGIAEGSTVVRAHVGARIAEATVVVRGTVAGVEVAPATAVVPRNGTVQLVASARTAAGQVLPRSFAWSSSDPAVAEVDADGRVRGIAAGEVVVSAEVEGVTGSSAVEVLPGQGMPDAVTVSPTSLRMGVGEQAQFGASATDGSGRPLPTSFTWSVSDPAVATVDAEGVLTAVAAGSLTLTATSSEGRSGSAAVTVEDGQGGGGGGHDEGYGNNLSYPVIFAEGIGLTGLAVSDDPGIRPTPDEGVVPGELPFFSPDNTPDWDGAWYMQQGPNTWQAEWLDGSGGGVQGATVYWGDNLTHHTWSTHSMIRVETVLYARDGTAMDGYEMGWLYGQGPDEMQGTNGTVGSYVPTLFAVTPRLTIEKLDDDTRRPIHTAFDGSVAEGLGVDGPGGYSAEVNVAGKVIFGYNFFIRNLSLPGDVHRYGWWRLTFSLDDQASVGGTPVGRNVLLEELGNLVETTDAAFGLLSAEDEEGGDELTYVPELASDGRSTWIDIYVESASGGGSGGGGGGGQMGPPARVDLGPSAPAVNVGASTGLDAEVQDGQGAPMDVQPVWRSSAPEVVSVDQAGVITGHAVGTAVVTATAGPASARVTVTVFPGVVDEGGDEGLGNNLSHPVVFPEGIGLTGLPVATDPGLRPLASEGQVVGALPWFSPANGPDYWAGELGYHLQQGENTWQAEWRDGALEPVRSTSLYWGDNLTKHTWNTHAVVRVEHVLAALDAAPLYGFEMAWLYGQGPDEMQGTTGSTAPFVPTVYTPTAQLVIQKLDDETRVPIHTSFEGVIADGYGVDGPGAYSAEINVAGKVIYGYNWFLRDTPLPDDVHRYGWWRITFRLLDAVAVDGREVVRNTSIDACGNIVEGEELLYTPVLDRATNTATLDLWIDQAGGGGGGGGSGHDGGGGGEGSGRGSCGGH